MRIAVRGGFRKYGPLSVLLALYSLLLAVFPLKMQAIESYEYAAGAEGLFNLSVTFQPSQPDNKLPDFSRYHPNHPILHAVAGLVFDRTQIPALTIFKAFNFLGAIASLAIFYLLCLKLWERHGRHGKGALIAAGAATTLMAVSHAFWLAALSGEVHLLALAFFLAAVYFLVLYLSAEAGGDKYLLWAAASAAAALALHLIVVFVLPMAVAVFWDSRRREKWRLYTIAALIMLVSSGIFYGILMVYVLGIDSVKQYYGTLFVYKFLRHIRYEGLEWYWVFLKSWAHVISFGWYTWGEVVKILVAGIYLWGFTRLLKSSMRKAVKVLLVLWPVSYILMHLLLSSRADSINYWHFVLPGVFIACGYGFQTLYRRGILRLLIYLTPAGVFVANFSGAVFPNSRLQEKDYLFVGEPVQMLRDAGRPVAINRNQKIAFLTKDPVLTFPEIYRMASEFGFRNQEIFIYCCGKTNYVEPLKKWIGSHESFFLIVDEKTGEMDQMLSEARKKFIVVKEVSGEIQQTWLPGSIYFSRPRDYRIIKHIRVFFVDPSL